MAEERREGPVELDKFEQGERDKIDSNVSVSETEINVEPLPSLMRTLKLFAPLSLTAKPTTTKAVIKRIEGVIGSGNLTSSTSPASSGILANAKALGRPLGNTPITFYDQGKGQSIATVRTNADGAASIALTTQDPTSTMVKVLFGKGNYPLVGAMLSTSFVPVTIWLVKWSVRNVNDSWARFMGRSLGEQLGHVFWGTPRWNAGLAGWCDFYELIPVLDTQQIRYDIGVSAEAAWWWDVTVWGAKKSSKEFTQYGVQRINRYNHCKCTVTADSISTSVVESPRP